MTQSSDPLAPNQTDNLDLGDSQDSYQVSNENDSSQNLESNESELSEEEKIAINGAINAASNALISKKMSRENAIEDVIAEGYSREEAELAVNAMTDYINKNPEVVSENQSSGGLGTLIFGVVCLTAGILLTVYAVNNAIWYGAIVVGIIEIFRGIYRMSK